MRKKAVKRTSRIEYMKIVLNDLKIEPQKFMYAVTHNAPSQTMLYHLITTLYEKQKPYIMTKRILLKKIEVEDIHDDIFTLKFQTNIIPAS